MIDIRADLTLIDTGSGVDLLVEENVEAPIRRLLSTRLGSLTLWVYQGRRFVDVDSDLGYGLYTYLADPLDLSWLDRARQLTLDALSTLPGEYQVNGVEVVQVGDRSVSIYVRYQWNGEEQSLVSEVNV